MRHREVDIQGVDLPDRLGDRTEAQGGEMLANLLGDVLEEGLDELGLAGEPPAQLRVLGGDADRAGVEMACLLYTSRCV